MKKLIFATTLFFSGCFYSNADSEQKSMVQIKMNDLNYQCRQIAYEANCGLHLFDCYVGPAYYREIRCATNVFIR